MKLILSKITPETPTEVILLEYAARLKRRLYEMQSEDNDICLGLYNSESQSVNQHTFKKIQFNGICFTDVDRKREGYKIHIKTSPFKETGKSFMMQTLVSDQECRSLSRDANLIYHHYKSAMKEITGIFND